MKKYELTEEHKKELQPWANRCIGNALSTKPMDDNEKEICRNAVKEMYLAAKLEPPPDERIVFVPSPFVLRFAGGFASAIWYLRKNKKLNPDAATAAATCDATDAATDAATAAATDDATYDATAAATAAATDAATRAATDDATDAATRDAIYAATDAATRAATYAATAAATAAATDDATYAATRDATYDATDAATYAATYDATAAATYDATAAATDAATYAATAAATDAATYAATRDATYDATDDATYAATAAATAAATDAATDDATRAAIYAATDAATRDATYDATYAATAAATDAATAAATDAATRDATRDAIYAATDDATANWFRWPVNGMINLSKALGLGILGLQCAQSAWRMWNGGNQWSGWVSFLTFFRYVAKLGIDYSKFDSYEKLAIYAGPRIMHEKFCMISDRPRVLKVDDRSRPHCDTGPFCEWSDGAALYALHGVRVPAWAVEMPVDKVTKEIIFAEKNTDVRREIFRRIGPERLTHLLGCTTIGTHEGCELITFDLGDGRIRPYMRMKCPTSGLTYIEGARPENTTPESAWRYQHNLTEDEEYEIVWQS